jgi:hypothetical protein
MVALAAVAAVACRHAAEEAAVAEGFPPALLHEGTASEEVAEATTDTAVVAADSVAAAVEAGEGQGEAEWPKLWSHPTLFQVFFCIYVNCRPLYRL